MSSAEPYKKPIIRRDRVFEFLIPQYVDDLDLSHGTALYLEDISVNFDGFQAISNLNFYVDTGELRCLIGPNGAGKTTLMDIVTGKTRPDTGSAWFGQRINLLRMDESQIAQAGIGRKFQKPSVFENLSVFDNLELSMAGTRSVWGTFKATLTGETIDRIEAMAHTINLSDQLNQDAGLLSHGQKQWLEIGMLIMQNPLLLLVDEPAAGMTHQEMDKTVELLQSLAGEHAIVVVEHDMEFVRALQSRVTVLHQGTVLAEGSMNDIQNNSEVMRVYLGTDSTS
jgi:urea transport system ATP-binding protein